MLPRRTGSRTAARKAKRSREVYDEMATLGVVLRSSDPKGVAEEAALASLVRLTKRLTPLGVVKG